jgi:CII-binding regulator of phage lambda lysogenization HflD
MNEKFTQLKSELEEYQDDPLQSRSFMYLDIISWLESKIHGKPVQQVIQEKYAKDKKRNS